MNEHSRDPDFSGAADTLAQAQEIMQKRRNELAGRISHLASQRRTYLASTVEQLLPGISPAVFEGLLQNVPLFLSSSVAEAFRTQRKVLGVFPRSGHKATLQLLQTRLAAHLDQAKFGELERIDQELSGLTADRSELDAQIHKALDLLNLMHQASKQNVQMRPEAAAAVADMARVGRAGGPAPRSTAPGPNRMAFSSNSAYATHTDSTASDNSDLWIYYLTDLPTSFRTLLISSIDEHRIKDATDHRHVTRDTTSHAPVHDDLNGWAAAASTESTEMACTANSVDDNMAFAVNAIGAGMIATDDRLGLFS